MDLAPSNVSITESQISTRDFVPTNISFDKKQIFLQKNSKSVIKENSFSLLSSYYGFWRTDARIQTLADNSVDLILTSPAYWQKRNYKVKGQIGQEKTPDEYVTVIADIMDNWQRILKDSGSVFLNIGESFSKGRRLRISSEIADEIERRGWTVLDIIIWEKPNSTPFSGKGRFPQREEHILHVVKNNSFKNKEYYFDLQAYKERFGKLSNVWTMPPAQHKGSHLAPFPEELVERILTVGCPKYVCSVCEKPFKRVTQKTAELDETRPQARRALIIAKENGLTDSHIAAIQAVGISDAGKALDFQSGAGRNNKKVLALAKEAKKILGGYFREFTFAKKKTIGWKGCNCKEKVKPGLVYDPFIGSGTTFRVAQRLNFSAIGSDLKIYKEFKQTLKKDL